MNGTLSVKVEYAGDNLRQLRDSAMGDAYARIADFVEREIGFGFTNMPRLIVDDVDIMPAGIPGMVYKGMFVPYSNTIVLYPSVCDGNYEKIGVMAHELTHAIEWQQDPKDMDYSAEGAMEALAAVVQHRAVMHFSGKDENDNIAIANNLVSDSLEHLQKTLVQLELVGEPNMENGLFMECLYANLGEVMKVMHSLEVAAEMIEKKGDNPVRIAAERLKAEKSRRHARAELPSLPSLNVEMERERMLAMLMGGLKTVEMRLAFMRGVEELFGIEKIDDMMNYVCDYLGLKES